jgi:hypothetical protein
MFVPIIIYGILMGLYIFIQPSLSFRKNGDLRDFGFQKGNTLFPVWVVAIIVAVFVGFVYHLISGSAEIVELRIIE